MAVHNWHFKETPQWELCLLAFFPCNYTSKANCFQTLKMKNQNIPCCRKLKAPWLSNKRTLNARIGSFICYSSSPIENNSNGFPLGLVYFKRLRTKLKEIVCFAKRNWMFSNIFSRLHIRLCPSDDLSRQPHHCETPWGEPCESRENEKCVVKRIMKKLSLGEGFLIIFTEIKSENKHRGSYLFSETKNSMEVRLFENDNRCVFFCGKLISNL